MAAAVAKPAAADTKAKPAAAVAAPFGLANEALVCHFNALLQALAGCPAIARAVQEHGAYFAKTRTGLRFAAFVTAYVAKGGPDLSGPASALFEALLADLKRRRPEVAYGRAQESASEGLILLLDMIEHEPIAQTAVQAPPSPLSHLFRGRYRCTLYCRGCRAGIGTPKVDERLVFDLGHASRVADAATFSEALRRHAYPHEDYTCPKCKKKTNIIRVYELCRIPEIVVCSYNLYGARPARHIPPAFAMLDKSGAASHRYAGVAQVVHAGGLTGGHYTATARRRDGKFYRFDDAAAPAEAKWIGAASSSNAEPESANVYLTFYCLTGTT